MTNTFRQYAELFLRTRPITPRTAQDYRILLSSVILPAWGDRDLTSIKASELRVWLTQLWQRAPHQARRSRVILRGIFELAEDDGIIDKNPTTGHTPSPHRRPNQQAHRRHAHRTRPTTYQRPRLRRTPIRRSYCSSPTRRCRNRPHRPPLRTTSTRRRVAMGRHKNPPKTPCPPTIKAVGRPHQVGTLTQTSRAPIRIPGGNANLPRKLDQPHPRSRLRRCRNTTNHTPRPPSILRIHARRLRCPHRRRSPTFRPLRLLRNHATLPRRRHHRLCAHH